jgi:hypothetical protein
MKLVELLVRSDSNRFAKKANRGRNMATEGHRYAGRKEIWSRIRRWFRYVNQRPREGLNDFEIEMRLAEDLKNCHEGRDEILDFQVGKEMRSLWDLKDCQQDSQGISNCQLGNEMRSLRDLTDYQEGSERFSVCQVGKET